MHVLSFKDRKTAIYRKIFFINSEQAIYLKYLVDMQHIIQVSYAKYIGNSHELYRAYINIG